MKKINVLFVMSMLSLMPMGCLERVPISAETQKLIQNTPPYVPVEYAPYLTLSGDGKSGSIVITVETPRGTQRRTLKSFHVDNGSKIDDATIRMYMNECNSLHDQINSVKNNAAHASQEFKVAKNALVLADKNATQSSMNLKAATKAENKTNNDIARLKASLVRQEAILVQRISDRHEKDRISQEADVSLESNKDNFNAARSRFEAANAEILRTIEGMGEASGQRAQK